MVENELLDFAQPNPLSHKISQRILKMMEKKNMTRDEAKWKLMEATASNCTENYMETLLDCLSALGLIKFEEPKSLELRFQEAVKPIYGFNLSEIELINNRLHMVGLKIVEK